MALMRSIDCDFDVKPSKPAFHVLPNCLLHLSCAFYYARNSFQDATISKIGHSSIEFSMYLFISSLVNKKDHPQ